MNKSALAIAAACLVAVMPAAAWAQAGNTGGSLGKHGKSASGDSAEPAAPPKPKRQKATASRSDSADGQPRARQGGGCGNLAGVWTANGWWNGLYGRGDVTLNADGTARHASGIVGTWTCSGNHFGMTWKDWAHGEGTLSADGNTMTYTDGNSMTRGR